MACIDSGHKVIRVVRHKDLTDLKVVSIRLRREVKKNKGAEFFGDFFFLFCFFFLVVGTVSSLFPCFPLLFLRFSLVFLHFSSLFPRFPVFFFGFS